MTLCVLKHREARAGETGLFPVDDRGAGVLHRIKIGREVKCDVRRSRNTRQLRLYWSILDFVAEHCPLFADRSKDDIADAVKMATGFVTRLIDAKTGEVFFKLRSIAEKGNDLDQGEFEVFFDEAMKQIANRWMPEGTTAETVRKELLALVDGPGAIGSRVA